MTCGPGPKGGASAPSSLQLGSPVFTWHRNGDGGCPTVPGYSGGLSGARNFFRPSLPPERPRKKLVVKLVVPEYTTKNQSERVMYPILSLLFPIVGSPLARAKSQRARPKINQKI